MTAEALRDRAIGAYLDAVASREPAPGGGSVAGVVAALGAALGEMVVRLSEGKAAYAGAMPALEEARSRLSDASAAALAAAAADEAAYARYRAASDLPKGSDEERDARAAAVQAALVEATETPLRLCRACLAMLDGLAVVAAQGNRHALSDARLGAYLADAAVRGALLNVRGNAAMLKDDAVASGYRREADRIEAAAAEGVAQVEDAAAFRG